MYKIIKMIIKNINNNDDDNKIDEIMILFRRALSISTINLMTNYSRLWWNRELIAWLIVSRSNQPTSRATRSFEKVAKLFDK